MYKKVSIIFLVILLAISMTACASKGKLISEKEVGIKVVDKHKDSTVDFIDTDTNAKVTIPVDFNIYGSLDIDQEIKANRSEYSKDNVNKYYYKIVLTTYNQATLKELDKAKSKIDNQVGVVITAKDIEHRTVMVGKVSTTETYYYIYYRYGNDSYTNQESVGYNVYQSATLGQNIMALKTDYVLQDGRAVTKYKLILK